MNVAIIDYGVGNLFSLRSSLSYLGIDNVLSNDAAEIRRANRLILPGVGAFGDAVAKLRESGLFDEVKRHAAAGKPLLGICLGMQLLFDKSYEFGEHQGLSLIPGTVEPLAPDLPAGGLKVPHIFRRELMSIMCIAFTPKTAGKAHWPRRNMAFQ